MQTKFRKLSDVLSACPKCPTHCSGKAGPPEKDPGEKVHRRDMIKSECDDYDMIPLSDDDLSSTSITECLPGQTVLSEPSLPSGTEG